MQLHFLTLGLQITKEINNAFDVKATVNGSLTEKEILTGLF